MAKTRKIEEFGDFQTPPGLALQVLNRLWEEGVAPASVVEPTCGKGNFLEAAVTVFPGAKIFRGYEINPGHVAEARVRLASRSNVMIEVADFFLADWPCLLSPLPEPVLLLGNPPWVTNAALGVYDSPNRPQRNNLHALAGIEALTGRSNFDLSEAVLLRLCEVMAGKRGWIAMLVKTAVARKACQYAWLRDLPVETATLFAIDAVREFRVAVQACLLLISFGARGEKSAEVYADLSRKWRVQTFGFCDGELVADLARYERTRHLRARSPQKRWRSGIKHDCAAVFELTREGDRYRNGIGERVELEPDYLYPFIKTSEVAQGSFREDRYLLVTQRRVTDDTACIEQTAPKTWAYLQRHREMLVARKSRIYQNRPAFSLFGVGDYSFAPWKVAISGLYKKLQFAVVPPREGKPVMLDDATYFLPANSEDEARRLCRLLNSPQAHDFFLAHLFWDAKRPITASLLNRLDESRLVTQAAEETPPLGGEME